MSLTRRIAEDVPWCQIIDGKVHAATWYPDGDGWLTTLTYDGDDRDTVICFGQSRAPFADLMTVVLPWRERAKLGLSICAQCVADLSDEADV